MKFTYLLVLLFVCSALFDSVFTKPKGKRVHKGGKKSRSEEEKPKRKHGKGGKKSRSEEEKPKRKHGKGGKKSLF